MTDQQLRYLGAERRLEQLNEERRTLLRRYPKLRGGNHREPAVSGKIETVHRAEPESPKRRRMSTAARKAISLRMKRLWKQRRGLATE